MRGGGIQFFGLPIVRLRKSRIAFTLFPTTLALLAGVLPLQGQEILQGVESTAGLVVSNARIHDDGVVTGVVVNRTTESIDEVRLLVRFQFLWKRERSPGPSEENPSRADIYDLPETVPPGGVSAFVYRPDPPLPERTDGRFSVVVQVLRYGGATQAEPPAVD